MGKFILLLHLIYFCNGKHLFQSYSYLFHGIPFSRKCPLGPRGISLKRITIRGTLVWAITDFLSKIYMIWSKLYNQETRWSYLSCMQWMYWDEIATRYEFQYTVKETSYSNETLHSTSQDFWHTFICKNPREELQKFLCFWPNGSF